MLNNESAVLNEKCKELWTNQLIELCSGLQDSEVSYFHSYIDGVDFVFLEAPPFRHRHNDIYGGERPVSVCFPRAFLAIVNSS